MKVAFLAGSTHRIPRLGGEVRVFHIAKFLASRGMRVGLFGSTFGEELMEANMSQRRSFKTWSGGDWYPFSTRSLPPLIRNIPSLNRQSQLLESYDVIISELGSAWQALASKPINRLPVVLDEHNVEWQLMRQQEISLKEPHPWKRLRFYEKICHRFLDHVLAVSVIDKLAFEREGTPAAKITVVPNGVDTDAFRPDPIPGKGIREKHGVNHDEPILMYMGSMKFFPNIDAVSSILKTIYPKARAMVPNLRLMITGPGSELLRDSVPYDIISTGVVDRSLLPAYISAADICLAPLKFGSGTRYKILEWMSCGKAIIATKKAAEGIDVTDGENIILEDNLEIYPALISDLWRDHDLRTTLGKNARVFLEDAYGWEKCVAPLEKLLRTL